MKLLVTGFTPFLNEKKNSTQEILSALPKEITHTFPVYYGKLFTQVLKRKRPKVLIMLGMHEKIEEPRFETVANNGKVVTKNKFMRFLLQLYTWLLAQFGKSLRLKKLPEKEQLAVIPIQKGKRTLKVHTKPPTSFEHSTNAGLFVCNYQLYQVEKFFQKRNSAVKRYFIHIPKALTKKNKKEILKFIRSFQN